MIIKPAYHWQVFSFMHPTVYRYVKYPLKKWLYKVMDWLILRQPTNTLPHTLMVVRLDVLGDMLMGLPFINWLRAQENWQNQTWILCANQAVKPLIDMYPAANQIFQQIIWVDRTRFNNSIRYRWHILKTIRHCKADTLLHPVHTWHELNHSVIRCAAAREKIAFKHIGQHYFGNTIMRMAKDYTRIVDTGPEKLFEFDLNKKAFEQLAGKECTVVDTKLPYQLKHNSYVNTSPYVILAPGAGSKSRIWPLEFFIKCAKQIEEKYAMPCYFIGAPAEQRFSPVIEKYFPHTQNLIGKLSLSETAYMIKNAKLTVANESGAVHLAVALGGKVVCVSNANHYGRWNPYPAHLHADVVYCYPPALYQIPEHERIKQYYDGSDLDIYSVDVEVVLNTIAKLL